MYLLLVSLFAIYSSENTLVRIACIFNSSTCESGIFDRENCAYPLQLYNILGDGYEVINFGVEG